VTLLLPGRLNALLGVSLKVLAAGFGEQVHLLQESPEGPPAVVEVSLAKSQVGPGGRPALVGEPAAGVPVVTCRHQTPGSLKAANTPGCRLMRRRRRPLTRMRHGDQSAERLGPPAAVEPRVHVQTEDVAAGGRGLLLDQRLDQLHPAGGDLLPTLGAGHRAHRQLRRTRSRTGSQTGRLQRRNRPRCVSFPFLTPHLSAGGHPDSGNLVRPVGEHVNVNFETNEEVLLCRLQEAFQEHDVPVQMVKGVTSRSQVRGPL